MDVVHVEKSKIENAQRELRRKEQAEGREWQRRFFKVSSGDPIFERLAKGFGGASIEAEKTNGVWRFDESKKTEQEEVEGKGVVIDRPPPRLVDFEISLTHPGALASDFSPEQ